MKRFFVAISTALALAGCNYGGIPQPDKDPEEGSSPSIERMTVAAVSDYSPAPGQFVNLLPPASEASTPDEVKSKAADYLNRGYAVTLGSFGGSITIRLAEPIARIEGKPEFFVGGNAITNGSEPGIVEVSSDGNVWYQLKGEFPPRELPLTHIIYRHDPNRNDIPFTATAPDGNATDGVVAWLPQYRSQTYWPAWVGGQTLAFTARRLPDNATLNPATGQYEFTPYAGYADSYPNSSPLGYLSIGDAVDPETGTNPELDSITYIRVTTAILQSNGPLGESSTEISGIYRLSY